MYVKPKLCLRAVSKFCFLMYFLRLAVYSNLFVHHFANHTPLQFYDLMLFCAGFLYSTSRFFVSRILPAVINFLLNSD